MIKECKIVCEKKREDNLHTSRPKIQKAHAYTHVIIYFVSKNMDGRMLFITQICNAFTLKMPKIVSANWKYWPYGWRALVISFIEPQIIFQSSGFPHFLGSAAINECFIIILYWYWYRYWSSIIITIIIISYCYVDGCAKTAHMYGPSV